MDYYYSTSNQTATISSEIDFMDLNSGLKFFFSFHAGKHLAIQLTGGATVGYESISFVSASENPPVRGFNFTPSKSVYWTDNFMGSLRLQYYF